MINPVLALMVAAVFAGVTAMLFWPERGLYWRWEHVLRASDRVLSEDALKHLFDCEYRELTGTLHSVTGALGISNHRAALVLGRLQELELVASSAGEYRLTTEGRSQALQIIRIHRLLEHHFSEDTGMDAAAWHREADRLEHRTSPDMIRFEVDGNEHTLSRVVADNLSVAELPEGESLEESFETLAVLDLGESATVVGISSASRGAERRRLMDLGLLPGTEVRAELQGPGGDPTGYRIRGAVIALRRIQAERIQIRRHPDSAAGGPSA